ncbi:neutral zinc metallopeptidase [Tepiditoga spiralis]|uniref:Neutral zinc metallopeptidase n=1 Tax=Tepiditoga spiralis TaxID=2108365 RepID=A0A7G1G814_9BACT|nr:zinc metallopeptidase [Tepiditoga spiralis]BBE31087.1 neutral zinc metallopeptidase [Tepiditoga spiralis]
MFFYDSTLILLIPAFIFSVIAQMKVKSTFNKYSRKMSTMGESGASFARRMLDSMGLFDVKIENVNGYLSDHYDPTSKILRLSNATYNNKSVAAIGVAAHEVGHAIQHSKGYKPLALRSAVVPMANFGSNLSWLIFFGGFIFNAPLLLNIGIILFSFVVAFTLITLPVEFDASRRALKQLPMLGMPNSEVSMVKSVLTSAAMTYVAAAAVAILQLIRMILLSRRD